MKKLIIIFMGMLATTGAIAQNEVDCGFTSINSNITSNRTLSASTLYRIEGCVHVTNGNTLTIPAATTVMFQKSSTASLTIDEGASLVVSGSSGSPVVFTSDQTPTNKAYGDWGGVIIEGKATNNVSGGSISVSGRTCSPSGGGVSDGDNSGSLQFLRIEYASYGLTLLSVGSGTTINNVMTSFIANNAFEFLGGTVDAKFLTSYNAKGDDYVFEDGNRSRLQFVVSVRLDASAHLSTGSSAIVMANDATGSSNTPLTHAVVSDATLIGPLYCGASGISSDFKNAVLYQLNTEGGVYNSFLGGWPTGLRMQDLATLDNANVNFTLNFSDNSFSNNTTDFSNNSTWPGTCSSSLSDWIMNNGLSSCAQPDNQFQSVSPYTVGYSSTICGTYSSTPPSFILSGSGLDDVDYTQAGDLDNAFFTTTGTRQHGGFNTMTDWTATWSNWDPQSFDPCARGKKSIATSVANVGVSNAAGLQLAPNPSNGVTYAMFNTTEAGNVTILVMDNLGRTLRTVQNSAAKGTQHIAVDTKGLAAGIYTIKVQPANGSMMHAQLVVE